MKSLTTLESLFLTNLESEIEVLKQLTEYIIEKDFNDERNYSKVFPKRCNNCKEVYWNRKDYVERTLDLDNGGILYDELGVQEYRNCTCGSTLFIRLKEKRDASVFGLKRRNLFLRCLAKIEAENISEDLIHDSLRSFFRKIIRSQYSKAA